jgi:hypothetical protein
MSQFQIFLHVAAPLVIICVPLYCAFFFLERYIDRRKARIAAAATKKTTGGEP